jgi:hypothetical protein
MMPWILMGLVIGFIAIVIVAIVAIKLGRVQRKEIERTGKYPEGYFVGMWMALGIAIFSGVGIPLSIATKNPGLIGIGPGAGVGFGVAIGAGIEEKMKKQGKIRPLTEKEKQDRNKALWMGVIALVIGIVAFVALLLLNID